MNKIIKFIALMIAAQLLLCACAHLNINGVGQDVDNQPYKSITAIEALELIGQEHVYLIDVREEDEFAQQCIPGAINIPLSNLGEQIADTACTEQDAIIVYCKGGTRSAKAARKLGKAGYKHVFDLGGIASWPYETVVANGT